MVVSLAPSPLACAVTVTEVLRLPDGAPAERRDDRVAVEEPLEIRLGGQPATVIMRTPGADEELALGFLFTEGLVGRAEDVVAMTRPTATRPVEEGNVLDVVAAPSLAGIRPAHRNFYASSSCGVCGTSSLAALELRAPRVTSTLRLSRSLVAALPERLRAGQSIFEETGGLHAAGLFDEAGAVVCLREDVGRHNAVDKVAGWALAARRLPADRCVLQVSGRTSFEILQKAIRLGVPVVCALGAPSSMAVQLAERFGVTLVGFLRAGSMNVYAHADRISD